MITALISIGVLVTAGIAVLLAGALLFGTVLAQQKWKDNLVLLVLLCADIWVMEWLVGLL